MLDLAITSRHRQCRLRTLPRRFYTSKSMRYQPKNNRDLSDHGHRRRIYEHCVPPEIAGRTAWYTSLDAEGREIVSRDAWRGGIYAEEYARFSPSRYCILPQIRLEPILRRRAVALNPDGVRYTTEVRDLEQFEDHVKLTVRSRDEDYSVKARFVIAADGGRSFSATHRCSVADRCRAIPECGEFEA